MSFEDLVFVINPVLEIFITGIFSVAGVLVVNLLNKFVKKYVSDNVFNEALDALREGIDVAEDEFVRWAKRSAEDGKLNKEEIYEAMELAREHALAVLDGPAYDLLASFSKERIYSLIKQLLGDKND